VQVKVLITQQSSYFLYSYFLHHKIGKGTYLFFQLITFLCSAYLSLSGSDSSVTDCVWINPESEVDV